VGDARNAGKMQGCKVRHEWMQTWLGHVYEGQDACTMAVMHGLGPRHMDWGQDMWTGARMHGLGLGRMDWGWDAWIGAGTHVLGPGCMYEDHDMDMRGRMCVQWL